MDKIKEMSQCQCGANNCQCSINRCWSIERQVRLASALFILLGIALAYTVSANWICLSAFVALGMIFSAMTNTCGMGKLLARMPWNCAAQKTCSSK